MTVEEAMREVRPTMELRFVRRHIDSDNGPGNKRGRMLMILQQKWSSYAYDVNSASGIRVEEEWRDVEVSDATE
jgi:hypothetical protein